MAEIPKTQKERDEFLKTFLIGEELEAEYDEVCNQSLKVAKKIDALIDKINEAKSKIKTFEVKLTSLIKVQRPSSTQNR